MTEWQDRATGRTDKVELLGRPARGSGAQDGARGSQRLVVVVVVVVVVVEVVVVVVVVIVVVIMVAAMVLM